MNPADNPSADNSTNDHAKQFIARWGKSGGKERANYQLFIAELCDVLDVARPDPATDEDQHNAYTFDRTVAHTRPDGTTTTNYIDCYKRGHFVLETKQGVVQKSKDALQALTETSAKAKSKGHGVRGTSRYDRAMRAAYNQAERYARALPVSEGMPPFLLVIDIGHSIEVYSDFSRSGKTYVPFPDPQTFRISLQDLERDEIRQRLRLIFTDPKTLDPSQNAARVTREVARHLAELSKSLEEQGYQAERTAHFLMRCIFTMFAEDVELIPKDGFRNLLKEFTLHTAADKRLSAEAFPEMVRDIWRAMDEGKFSVNLKQKLQRFNGGLFADTEVLGLNETQITMLYNAATSEWRDVEPAIFGTLLERALNPTERHKLGAHYTPRAYVERLVLPTVIEPLREDWDSVLTAAVLLDAQGKWQEAVGECRDYLMRLTQTLVLDPACGTGNFLYVTLDHMKRLEGEVRNAMAEFTGSHQAEIEASEFQVDPHQFLGIEVNPRAAAIAELVLWIGYLQWQIKALGTTRLPEPVLKAYHNIECRDAVLDYSGTQPRLDDNGEPVTRWDGETKKTHPVTGEEVPDETARVPVLDYLNPRPAVWPMAHFIVGNPPFLGTARMRAALGDGYAEVLRSVYRDVPESADFVMYWWHKAAEYLRTSPMEDTTAVVELVPKEVTDKKLQKSAAYLRRKHLHVGNKVPVLELFGFITTNSLRQTFNRRVLQQHMDNTDNPISLAFAIPDHPWVESADGAAVRIAMTVAQPGKAPGVLQMLESEANADTPHGESSCSEIPKLILTTVLGTIQPNLTIGAQLLEAKKLQSNIGLGFRGISVEGDGFVVSPLEAARFEIAEPAQSIILRRCYNGKDVIGTPRDIRFIDLYGMTEDQVRQDYPSVYQWLLYRVKLQRDESIRKSRRDHWWLFGETRPGFRGAVAGLSRYIVTPMTAKHRFFVSLDIGILPDQGLIAWALEDAFFQGVLSSKVHLSWTLAMGGTLEDRPRYNNSVCFETFPFPIPTPNQTPRIRDLAERLDSHRKRQQELHLDLSLTDCYNVLEKLRAGEVLTAKDKRVHEEGLVTVLLQLHDELDAAVAEAYGWPADLTDEEILTRLVDLNRERAAEEAQGLVRWLRPEYQNPAVKGQATASQEELLPGCEGEPAAKPGKGAAKGKGVKPEKIEKLPWPKTLPEQAKAVYAVMREREGMPAAEVAGRFAKGRVDAVSPIMETLAALGHVG